MNLTNIERFKIKKSINKYLIIAPISITFLLSICTILMQKDNLFFYNISIFSNFGFSLLIPLGIGLFCITSVCSEYKNKTIRYVLNSKFSNVQIVLSKFISIIKYILEIYLIFITIYYIFCFYISDTSQIYINFVKLDIISLIRYLIELTFYDFIYLSSVSSIAISIAFLLKRQDLPILLYFLIIVGVSLIDYDISKYTFISASLYDYSNLFGLYSDKITVILSSISNIFLNIYISALSLKKFTY